MTRRAFLCRAGALSLAAASPPAPAPRFRIERVSEHVYAGVALAAPVVNGNSGFIVTEEGLIVVDAQSSPSAARALYRQFTCEVAELPVRYLVDTHHHLDHAQGNRAYVERFGPRIDVVSTAFARAALAQSGRWLRGFVREQPVDAAELRQAPNQDRYYAFLEGYLGGLRRELRSHPTETAADPRLRAIASYFDEAAAIEPALPNLTFDRSLVLHCGGVEVEVRHLGRAHTAGDAVVFVPADRVVLTGDLAHGIDPLFFEAFPDEWPATLGRLEALDFAAAVPAHGPVQRGKAMLVHFRDYVAELNRLVREGLARGRTLAALQTELEPGRFTSLAAGGYGQALQRNREELLGLPPGQPLEPVVAYGVEQVYRYYAPETPAH